jgi:hypothetical protein
MKSTAIKSVSSFINRNTGFLIAVLIVIFGLFIINFKKENARRLDRAGVAAEERKQIDENTQQIIVNVQKAVEELKEDNAQQTVILCNLILGGRINLSGEDAAEVERICQERIAANVNRQQVIAPDSAAPPAIYTTPTPNNEQQKPATPEPQAPTPEQPEESGIVEGVIDRIRNLFN